MVNACRKIDCCQIYKDSDGLTKEKDTNSYPKVGIISVPLGIQHFMQCDSTYGHFCFICIFGNIMAGGVLIL